VIGADVDRPPIRCSANIAFLFPGLSLEAGLDAAHANGFRTVELIEPYMVPPTELARMLDERGMRVDLVNVPFGDLQSGDRGFAGDPSRIDEYSEALDVVAELARLIRPAKANVLAGFRVPGVGDRDQADCLAGNVSRTADRMADLGVATVVEMLNPVENPGFLLDSPPRVAELLDRLGGRAGFQLDVFHLQRAGFDPGRVIVEMRPYTWHVQIADSPRRTEPGSGEIDVRAVLDRIASSGYDGLVGLEYRPSSPAADLFGWMAAAGCVPA
jgi:hydroxypyruvate isomerase